MRAISSLVAFAALTVVASAQGDSAVIAALAGPWEFSDAGGKTCRISFSTEAAIHGFSATAEALCNEVWPGSGDISGWTILEDGSLRLLDPLGKSLMDFPEAENGLYQHLTDGKADYSLVNVDEEDFRDLPPEP
jgi:hypothetical protein